MFRFRCLAFFSLLWPILTTAGMSSEDWQVSGFTSLGLGRMQEPGLEFLGYDNEKWRAKGDSVLGLQLNADMAERLSMTLQVVSRGYNQDDTNSFEPELDWLFLSYHLNSAWRIRIGRMRTPHYLYSETVDVGYSYVWARPPIDVYSTILSTFSYFDGADIRYLTHSNNVDIDLQLFSGYMKRSRDNLEIKVEPMIGGNISLQWEQWKLRYGLIYDRTDIRLQPTANFESNLEAVIAFDSSYQSVKDALNADDAWYRYQTLGLHWDGEPVAIISEVFDIKNTDDGFQNDAHGWYLSAHMPLGKFTPYLVRGAFTNEYNLDAFATVNNSLQSFPTGQPGYEGFDAFRLQALNRLELNNYDQSTWTLGLRYDLMSNVALKAEWQRFDFHSNSSGQITRNAQDTSSHAALTTLIIDVVF